MNPTINILNNLNVAKDKEWNTKQETTTQKTNKDMLETESSLELIDTERKDNYITTCSKYLDQLLGGGIPLGRLTEICGNSGCGKSMLCFQLATNVQLPGLDGECIYIDTEGSFRIKTSDKIHLFRVLSYAELLALIHQLNDILVAYPKVKLIIIDSIVYHFRLNTLEYGKRPVLLAWIAQTLDTIAQKQGIAVVMTNHVTRESEEGPWIPSLGPFWGRFFTNRLFLYRRRGGLFGYLYKSMNEKDIQNVQFCIKDSGIADPDLEQLIDFNEKHDIDQKMKEAWQDIINRKQKQEEPINPEQDSIWEEHISDEILYELPSQSMVYEFNENDDDATDSTSSDNITQLMTADETPQLSLLFSSSPPTVDEDIYLTLLDDDDDQDITFIQNDTCHFEDQILLKTSEEYFTHFNKTDCEALGKF